MIIYGPFISSYPMGPYELWMAGNCTTGTFRLQLLRGGCVIYEDHCLDRMAAIVRDLLKSRK